MGSNRPERIGPESGGELKAGQAAKPFLVNSSIRFSHSPAIVIKGKNWNGCGRQVGDQETLGLVPALRCRSAAM